MSSMKRLSFFATPPPLCLRKVAKPQAKCYLHKMSAATTEEHFDILLPDGTPAGYSKPRSQVHRDGDWHRSTHIWVLAADGRILLQKRSSLKDTFPGRWDVSAAGHISAGDTSRPSAERELSEELGIMLQDGEGLEFVVSEPAVATGSTKRHGEFVDKEIQDIYVYRPKTTIPVEHFVLQKEEVDQVQYWDWSAYREKLVQDDSQFVPRSPGYFKSFFPWLQSQIFPK